MNVRTGGVTKKRRIVLFSGMLLGVGGAERLLLEEVDYFRGMDFDAHVLTFDFDEQVLFNRNYRVSVEQIGRKPGRGHLLVKIITAVINMFALRKRLKQIRPHIIISSSALGCVYLYFATLFTGIPYATYVHGSIFWFHIDLMKYARIHRKVFNEIWESVPGHMEFIPAEMPKIDRLSRVLNEIAAITVYHAMQKAKKVFVHSEQMRWEVDKLYGKEAVVVKGAFSGDITAYRPKQDIKTRLGLKGQRMILNVNRLEARKRVDMLIKAYKKLSGRVDDTVLVIGGVGEDEEKLKNLAAGLDVKSNIRFVGYIREEELWDYISACDLFVHPNWADYAIAAYEPLALQKKVVWSTEMEIDEHLAGNRHIFTAHPDVEDFTRIMEEALAAEVMPDETTDLSAYTWENFCKKVFTEIEPYLEMKGQPGRPG
jgi:glycosyltransferase involved in cell wall biosynthesis